MGNMIANGLTEVVEVGPGTVLQGLFKKAGAELQLSSANVE
jgi:[acyl-carrier-protein] S-malonyltransferase